MRFITFILVFFYSFSYGQNEVGYIFEEMPSDSLVKRTVKSSSNITLKLAEGGGCAISIIKN